MYRVISGTIFTLAAAACLGASPAETVARDQIAASNALEAGGSSDVGFDATKAVSRKPKPRIHHSVPPRKKN
jgi:hypothetical protein